MLPDIERQQRLHPLVNHGRVGVVQRGDLERAAVEHQPGPAAGEMADRLLLQLGEQRVGPPKPSSISAASLPDGLLPLGRRQALPEEAVVPVLRAVVEQALVALLLGGADHVGQRRGLRGRSSAKPLILST